MKDWISINGRTFLAEEFIRILDNYRSRRIVINRGEVERQKYCRIIFVLQELTNDYMQGVDFVADELSNSQPIHKSHKIQDVIDEHDGHLNLHQIKTKTGAGSGHKH